MQACNICLTFTSKLYGGGVEGQDCYVAFSAHFQPPEAET